MSQLPKSNLLTTAAQSLTDKRSVYKTHFFKKVLIRGRETLSILRVARWSLFSILLICFDFFTYCYMLATLSFFKECCTPEKTLLPPHTGHLSSMAIFLCPQKQGRCGVVRLQFTTYFNFCFQLGNLQKTRELGNCICYLY